MPVGCHVSAPRVDAAAAQNHRRRAIVTSAATWNSVMSIFGRVPENAKDP